jgi:hypothetical protein
VAEGQAWILKIVVIIIEKRDELGFDSGPIQMSGAGARSKALIVFRVFSSSLTLWTLSFTSSRSYR